MKLAFLFILLITPQLIYAQLTNAKTVNNCNVLFKNFLPKYYTVLDTANSDFNNDGLIDVVIVAHYNNKTKDVLEEKNRAIIILQKTKAGFIQKVKTLNGMLCKSCGGLFGDPYQGISLKKNILTLNNYGGSSWRWSITYIFRYQKKDWQLIGYRNISYHSIGCNGNCDVIPK